MKTVLLLCALALDASAALLTLRTFYMILRRADALSALTNQVVGLCCAVAGIALAVIARWVA